MRGAKHLSAVAGVGIMALLGAAAIAGSTTARGAHADNGDLAQRAGIPLTFVENRGQIDARVRYYAQGNRYAFYATRDQLMLSFRKKNGPSQLALALRFVGRNPSSVPEGAVRMPGRVNYLRGA